MDADPEVDRDLPVGLQILPVMIVAERKILGRFQNRYGPNRVGPFGISSRSPRS